MEKTSSEREKFMTINEVRKFVHENSTRESIELSSIDPEIIAIIDKNIDFNIFITGDEIYTSEHLYKNYSFNKFKICPESVFTQQAIEMYESSCGTLDYILCDIRKPDDICKPDDTCMPPSNTIKKRIPIKIITTKVYLGKENWEDFKLLNRIVRSSEHLAIAQIAYHSNLCLDDTQREKDLSDREESQQKTQQKLDETQKKLDQDMKRIEEIMFTLSSKFSI